MLIRDEAVQTKHAKRDPQEQRREEQKLRLKEELNTYYTSEDFDPLNPEKQRGKPMSAETFEKLVSKMIGADKVQFQPHPKGLKYPAFRDRKVIWLRDEQGNMQYYTTYNLLLPERSIMLERTEWIPDPDAVTKLPKTLYIPDPENPGEMTKLEKGTEVPFIDRSTIKEGDPHAGMIAKKTPWIEIVRGWTPMLILMVLDGLVKPELVKRELNRIGYKTPNNAFWAVKVEGRKGIKLPF